MDLHSGVENVVFLARTTHEYDEVVLDKYVTKQVDVYKKQDTQHKRALSDNYVTGAWLNGQLGKVCHDCGDYARLDV